MLAWLPNHSSSTSEPIQKLSRRPSPRAPCHHPTKRSKQLQRRLETKTTARPVDWWSPVGRPHAARGQAPTAWICVATSPLPPDRAADHAGASDRPAENLSRLAAHKPGPTHAVPPVQAAVLPTGPKYPMHTGLSLTSRRTEHVLLLGLCGGV